MLQRVKDTYGEPEIITDGIITAKVYSPILTEEERARRMEAIKRATVQIVLYGHRKEG